MLCKLKAMFLCLLFVFIGSLSFSFDSYASSQHWDQTIIKSFDTDYGSKTVYGPDVMLSFDGVAYTITSSTSESGRYLTTNNTFVTSGSISNTVKGVTADSIEFDYTVTFNYNTGTLFNQTFSLDPKYDYFKFEFPLSIVPISTFSNSNYYANTVIDSIIFSFGGQSNTYYNYGSKYVYSLTYDNSAHYNPGFWNYTCPTITVKMHVIANCMSIDNYLSSGTLHLGFVLQPFVNGGFTFKITGIINDDVDRADIEYLANGYDKSNTLNDNTNLNNHLDAMDQAEDNLTNQGFSNIDNVQMVDITATPAMMLTAISFCSSFLQSLFVNLGVFNYWILISLSMTIALVLIGWMRFK